MRVHLSDFEFELPPQLIAKYPPQQRSGGRLLDLSAEHLVDRQIIDLPALIQAGDLVVFNDTQVIPARLFGQKSSGGKVEMLLERLLDSHRALVHLRASKSPKIGALLEFHGISAEVTAREGALFELRFEQAAMALFEQFGHMPLPPYLAREDQAIDQNRYQTVYAAQPGAVAAPTAGLHFDQALLDALKAKGAEFAKLTLHVGAGTFSPIKTEDIDQHVMHRESVHVDADVAQKISRAKAEGRRIVAVGTTVVRSLETMALSPRWAQQGFSAESQLFIRPGFDFKLVDAMLTNFHLPRSTLLMLVSAFSGVARVRDAYAHAIAQSYRFYSYGDAMFLTRRQDAEVLHEV